MFQIKKNGKNCKIVNRRRTTDDDGGKPITKGSQSVSSVTDIKQKLNS